ncbi:uncharacterized protein [Aquarana catesbeiana]|uniref:uncharacterized protein n=1 Tax=Aquarana catesbeiana TaxID=8400 RepID=UPI003CC93304
MKYELRNEQDLIGWYEGDKLEPRGRFMERLEFDNQRCAFILLSISKADTGMYTILALYMENKAPKSQEMTFNVTIVDIVTSTPTPPASNLTDCKEGIPAVCFSLAPLMNVITNGVFLLSCWQRWASAGTQDFQYILLVISGFASLTCQVVSIGLWLSCGILNNLVWFGLAVSCTAILVAFHILSFKCVKSDCFNEKLKLGLAILLQFSFTGFVVIAFHLTHGKIIIQTVWALIIFAVVYLMAFTLPYIAFIIYHSYCRPKRTEEEDATEMQKLNTSENDSSIQKTEKGPPLVV